MARSSVTYLCGHTGTVQGYNRRDADGKAEWAAKQHCFACNCAAKNEAATKAADQAGLPQLTGSEKQIGWANKLRLRLLSEFRQAADKARLDCQDLSEAARREVSDAVALLESEIGSHREAGWWIDASVQENWRPDTLWVGKQITSRGLAPTAMAELTARHAARRAAKGL